MSGSCSIYSPEANLSPKKTHKHYIARKPWAFRSEKYKIQQLGTMARPCSALHGPCMSSEQNNKKGDGRRTRPCACRHTPCLSLWNLHVCTTMGAQSGSCQARSCLIFLHRIFIFLASISSKSCSRSFLSIIMLQNPFFCSKTRSFIIFVHEIK